MCSYWSIDWTDHRGKPVEHITDVGNKDLAVIVVQKLRAKHNDGPWHCRIFMTEVPGNLG